MESDEIHSNNTMHSTEYYSATDKNGDTSSDAEFVTYDSNMENFVNENISVEITTTEIEKCERKIGNNATQYLTEKKRKNFQMDSQSGSSDEENLTKLLSDLDYSAEEFTEPEPSKIDENYSARKFLVESRQLETDDEYSAEIMESELNEIDESYSANDFLHESDNEYPAIDFTESEPCNSDGDNSAESELNKDKFSIEITTNARVRFGNENLNSGLENDRSISNRAKHKCNICKKEFTRKIDMLAHRLAHTREQHDPSLLKVKMTKFNNKKKKRKIEKRILERERERLDFSCAECDRSFWTVTQFEEHQKIHCDQTGLIHRCKLCDCGFSTEEDLDLHVLEHKQTLKCHKCGWERRKSILNEGGRLKPSECEQCGMISSFVPYTQPRSNQKPFKCEICGCEFTRQGNLKRHEKVHTKFGETERANLAQTQIFTCDSCGKEFSRRGNLHRHELIHTAQKPYVCHCGKAFTQPSHLKTHGMTHTKERPFECAECRMTFTRKGNLKRHVQLHVKERNQIYIISEND